MSLHDANAADGRLSGDAGRVADAFAASVARRATFEAPYRHYLLEDLFPADVADALADLPFAAPDARRRLRPARAAQRLAQLFRCGGDGALSRHAGGRGGAAVAAIVRLIAESFAAPIDDTFLRLEYAQDVDGFWLEPHTDLGVKKFTCLIYLSDGPGHEKLGTDIYWSRERHFGVVAVQARRGDGLRARRQHLARLREAQDRGRAPLGDPQLRHPRLARARAAVVPRAGRCGFKRDERAAQRLAMGRRRRPRQALVCGAPCAARCASTRSGATRQNWRTTCLSSRSASSQNRPGRSVGGRTRVKDVSPA